MRKKEFLDKWKKNERFRKIVGIIATMLKNGTLVGKEGKIMISGKFAFLALDTYGIYPDILEDWVNKWIYE